MKFKVLIAYVKKYWITSALFGYMLITTILKSIALVDLTIPCPIKLCTGKSCYGCGLTTATTHLFHLDINQAYEANALIFIVLPLLLYAIIRHYIRFMKEFQ